MEGKTDGRKDIVTLGQKVFVIQLEMSIKMTNQNFTSIRNINIIPYTSLHYIPLELLFQYNIDII